MVVIDKNFKGRLSTDIDDYPEGLVVVIDKPFRWTSADVIRKIKYAAIRHFGKKNLKVGHAGTLDPLATGVLLVCIGNACKNAEKLQATSKEYVAGVCFGATTPSYDLEKEADRTFPLDGVSEQSVRDILPSFVGEQDQVAPLFSAKSVDGVRAYELARKLYGEGGSMDAAAAELLRVGRIRIDEMELLDYSPAGADGHKYVQEHGKGGDAQMQARTRQEHPQLQDVTQRNETPQAGKSPEDRIHVAEIPQGLPVATIRIACSKGTYIRALARDLGERLGSGAFLSSLQRSRSGQYRVTDALGIAETISLLCPDPYRN